MKIKKKRGKIFYVYCMQAKDNIKDTKTSIININLRLIAWAVCGESRMHGS